MKPLKHLAFCLVLFGFSIEIQARPRCSLPPFPEFTPMVFHADFDEPYWGGTRDASIATDYGTLVESWSGYALQRSESPTPPFFISANNSDGAIRFWFKPDWTSGKGPGYNARLIEAVTVKDGSTAWVLYTTADGMSLYLSGQTFGRATDLLKANIVWQAGQWYAVTLNYSEKGTALYVDGGLVSQGSGIFSTETSVFIGSTALGTDPSAGDFDNIDSFARPLTGMEVSFSYNLLAGLAALGPISAEEEEAREKAATARMNYQSYTLDSFTCVTGGPAYLTNMSCTLSDCGSVVSFTIAGGTNGVLYDVYRIQRLIGDHLTNSPWRWMGQFQACDTCVFTNQPDFQAYYFLGTSPPKAVPGLRMWLRTENVQTNNAYNRVLQWDDQSGNGNNAVQSTPSSQPFLVTTAFNGKPAIGFYGTNYLAFANNLFTNMTEGEVFVVLQASEDPPSVNRGLWHFGTGLNYYPHTNGTISDNFGDATVATGDPSQPLNQPHLYNVTARTGEWTSRINGVVHYSKNTNAVQFPSSAVWLGNSSSGLFAGYISEVLIYSRALTPAERFFLGTYLSARYSLVTSAPAIPTNLTAFAVSTNQISISWDAALSNTNVSFTVQRKTGTNDYSDLVILQNSASFLDSGLAAGAEYYYRVKAANYFGESDCSSEANATTLTSGRTIPLDSLKVWLKADSGRGGGSVNCWADQTTNNWNAFQVAGTIIKQPVSVETEINGRPAIYFQGTNAFSMLKFTEGWSEGEVFVVLKSLGYSSPPTNTGLWLMGNGAYVSRYPYTNGVIWDNFGRNSFTLETAGASVSSPHVYNVISQANNWANRVNNSLIFSTNVNVVGFSGSPRLGWGVNNDYFRGYISELMFFNRGLTDAERGIVATNYLRQRFNLW